MVFACGRLPYLFEVPIRTEERGCLFDELSSLATSGANIPGITAYASQHCLSGNTVFDSSFPGFPGSGLGVTTSTFWVCLPRLFELVGIVLFGREIFRMGFPTCANIL